MMNELAKKGIYAAISAAMGDLARTGIGKNQTNSFDRYRFRGIDDVYNALSPLMAKHGICIFPRVLSRESVERQSDKNKALFYVTVEVEFDFVSASDGSTHVVKAFGEAMDRGDKATNKAMSAAYKYAMLQVFCIPTEAQDSDSESHQVKTRSAPATYSEGAFTENLPKWRKAVVTGRVTPEQVIERASAKGKLTDKMQETIRNLTAIEAEAEVAE